MRVPHLFEFMDLKWLPPSLHATLREILECGNARPFRPYYEWVENEVKQLALATNCRNTVELGAGTAPVSRLLAKDPDLDGVKFIVCDGQPDKDTYADLEKQYPGKVMPRYEAVDFSQPQTWPPDTLLFLSGTFHHIPPDVRLEVLKTLSASCTRVMVCEPLRKDPISICFVFLSIVPALLLPLWFFGRPGKLRRLLWCWFVPVAPLMFWWDGVASCLRMWTNNQWLNNLRSVLSPEREVTLRGSLFSQLVSW